MRPCIHQGHANTQNRKNCRELDANHTTTNNCHRTRQILKFQHVIAGEDALAIKRNMLVTSCIGPYSQHNLIRGNFLMLACTRHIEPDCMIVQKAGMGRMQIDPVPQQLVTDNVHFRPDHIVRPVEKIAHSDFLFNRIRGTIDVSFSIAGQIEGGFAERLTRNGSLRDTNAADNGTRFHDTYTLTEFSRLNRCPLSTRTGSNHEKVVIVHHSTLLMISAATPGA